MQNQQLGQKPSSGLSTPILGGHQIASTLIFLKGTCPHSFVLGKSLAPSWAEPSKESGAVLLMEYFRSSEAQKMKCVRQHSKFTFWFTTGHRNAQTRTRADKAFRRCFDREATRLLFFADGERPRHEVGKELFGLQRCKAGMGGHFLLRIMLGQVTVDVSNGIINLTYNRAEVWIPVRVEVLTKCSCF